jgi:hypothetical protein
MDGSGSNSDHLFSSASEAISGVLTELSGSLAETVDVWKQYCLTDPDGGRVEPVAEFLRDLEAGGRPATTQRSYAVNLRPGRLAPGLRHSGVMSVSVMPG